MTPLLLALDYPGRREEARVRDLHLEDAGFDVRYLLAPPFVRQLTAPAYAAELIARYGPFEPPPTAVLAYCMAAPIAQEVAGLCGAGGEPVPLLVFDGEPATPSAIEQQYRASVDQFRAQFGVADQADRRLPFDRLALSSSPGECVERMRRCLVELGVTALRQDADPDEEFEDLEQTAGQVADFYVAWLVHLVAAHNASWPQWRGEVLHIASRDHGWTCAWPGARATAVRRVEADRDELLSHPDVRDLVLAFLGRAPAAAPGVERGAPA